MNWLEAIQIIKKLITILGDIKMSEAVKWMEVQQNAENLKEQEHPNSEYETNN